MYDKTKEFEAEVEPLVDQLYETCNRLGINLTIVVEFGKGETVQGQELFSRSVALTVNGEHSWLITAFHNLLNTVQMVSSVLGTLRVHSEKGKQ